MLHAISIIYGMPQCVSCVPNGYGNCIPIRYIPPLPAVNHWHACGNVWRCTLNCPVLHFQFIYVARNSIMYGKPHCISCVPNGYKTGYRPGMDPTFANCESLACTNSRWEMQIKLLSAIACGCQRTTTWGLSLSCSNNTLMRL